MSSEIVNNNNHSEEACLKKLKLLINENRELDDFQEFLDDRFVLHFLRGKKNDVKKAQLCLENFFNVRSKKYRELFKSLRPSTNLGFKTQASVFLKNHDHLNRLVVIHRLRFWDPAEVPLEEMTNMTILYIEEMWNDSNVEFNGIVLVFDVDGFKSKHAMAYSISEIIKGVSLLWHNYPIRPQAVHVINEVFAVTIIYQTIKYLLPKKIGDRVFFHNSKTESLHKHINPAILPKSLGGKLSEDDAYDSDVQKRIKAKENYYEKFASLL